MVDLPKPPEHFSDAAVDCWYKTGITLIRNERLSESNLKHLEDICYWEDYKNRIRENLRFGLTVSYILTPKFDIPVQNRV